MKATRVELSRAVLALYAESDTGLSLIQHAGGAGLPAVVILVARHPDAMDVLRQAHALMARKDSPADGAAIGRLIVPLRARETP